jgi:hypothetical protein
MKAEEFSDALNDSFSMFKVQWHISSPLSFLDAKHHSKDCCLPEKS